MRKLASQKGEVYQADAEKSNFDFSRDISQNLQMFKDAGFAQVKHWY